MEIFDIIEDDFDDFMDLLTESRRDPVFRHRINYMEALDDTEFKISRIRIQ